VLYSRTILFHTGALRAAARKPDTAMKAHLVFLFTCTAWLSASAATTVDEYALEAARAANATYKNLSDDSTLSARAYASGGKLTHEYVINVKSNISLSKKSQWRGQVRGEVVTSTCNALKNDVFFNERGYQIQYIYLDPSKTLFDEFTVNSKTCKDVSARICSIADQRITISELRNSYPGLFGLDDRDAARLYRDTFYQDMSYEHVACNLGISLIDPPAPPKPVSKSLGAIDKWRYESCLMDATKSPTPLGVTRGTQLCKTKFEQID